MAQLQPFSKSGVMARRRLHAEPGIVICGMFACVYGCDCCRGGPRTGPWAGTSVAGDAWAIRGCTSSGQLLQGGRRGCAAPRSTCRCRQHGRVAVRGRRSSPREVGGERRWCINVPYSRGADSDMRLRAAQPASARRKSYSLAKMRAAAAPM
jgi:hypothetical protein